MNRNASRKSAIDNFEDEEDEDMDFINEADNQNVDSEKL